MVCDPHHDLSGHRDGICQFRHRGDRELYFDKTSSGSQADQGSRGGRCPARLDLRALRGSHHHRREAVLDHLREMRERAQQALSCAYAPYSGFRVGACVRTKDGRLYGGANVENASYGLSCCAERNALFAAYADGVRSEDIEALMLIGTGDGLLTPCGACRQVMAELMRPDAPVIMADGASYRIMRVCELLPYAFDKEDLNGI
ncbi:MAG TPA: cytidine deaminase [Candidatus Merdibacter merdipullorum]|nr:cytidine deaminase [Candidatus Merdibacter merdipullorum]